jgi:hypothetical protein
MALKIKENPDGSVELEGTPEEIAEYKKRMGDIVEEVDESRKDGRRILNEVVVKATTNKKDGCMCPSCVGHHIDCRCWTCNVWAPFWQTPPVVIPYFQPIETFPAPTFEWSYTSDGTDLPIETYTDCKLELPESVCTLFENIDG